MELGVADLIVDDYAELVYRLDLQNRASIRHEATGVERFLRFFASPIIQSILMLMMMGGLYFELQTPGVGFPGLIAAIGAAVFFDAGAAWFAGREGDPTELGLLRDVGFGLRLSSTRSSRGSMLHLDLAFPLDGDDSIESVQFLVKAKQRF